MNPFSALFNKGRDRQEVYNQTRTPGQAGYLNPGNLGIAIPEIAQPMLQTPAELAGPRMHAVDPDRFRRDGEFAPNNGNPLTVDVRKRPDMPSSPAPGLAPSNPTASTPAAQPKGDFEYFKGEDDMGRGVWQTRPSGFVGVMGGQHGQGQYANENPIQGFRNKASQALAGQFRGGQPGDANGGFGTPQTLQQATLPDGTQTPLPPSRPTGLEVTQTPDANAGWASSIDPSSTVGGMIKAFGGNPGTAVNQTPAPGQSDQGGLASMLMSLFGGFR